MGKAYQVVRDFEEEVASWCGAKYGVAVESCCAAIFLCLQYLKPVGVWIPKRTYPGVGMAVLNANCNLILVDFHWEGSYRLCDTNIIDSALKFKKGMYEKGTFTCLSFHYKKHLSIGRGGMILADDEKAVEWLKMARFDGRKEIPLLEDNATILGWNMYMTPEQAARGLALFEAMKHTSGGILKVEDQNYPDLSKWKVFNEEM